MNKIRGRRKLAKHFAQKPHSRSLSSQQDGTLPQHRRADRDKD